jgi:choline dehydrogenase-like flavoprotein
MANKVDSYHTVVVIGAGAAGLYAAQQLRQQYPDVLVVEAQNHVGGRIRQVGRCRLNHTVICMSTTRGGPCRGCHAALAVPAAVLAGSLHVMCCTHEP